MQARANMNLTRDEAQSRARVLSVDTYEVELDLTREEPTYPRPGDVARIAHHRLQLSRVREMPAGPSVPEGRFP